MVLTKDTHTRLGYFHDRAILSSDWVKVEIEAEVDLRMSWGSGWGWDEVEVKLKLSCVGELR